ncbi:ATP-binding cassette domain-containing protein [Acuticoccus sp. I52.16.1]|uniref:ATP-binding cassette domain-containing protein n=1 Tax=Acuticoccus sp. I52.16.1 TaxID=2928472 RepID=UPI001FD2C09D|nr:ABC transporter transmembrane domain-containing protein [Acuticoccus sp. I52.16.1]UOM32598.1 ATP-binding cassette domain-containing protein [Acuticoccus sp. I52.16.1]
MSTFATPNSSAISRIEPAIQLAVLTMALNLMGLALPIAVAQIFDRIIPNPGTSTLSLIAVGIVAIGAMDALLRYARAAILARAGANFAGAMTHRVLAQVLLARPGAAGTSPSQSLEYLSAIGQLKEKYNGQVLVSLVELLFLPMMVAVIFWISTTAGVLVTLALVVFALRTWQDAVRMRGIGDRIKTESEVRYNFLFNMLGAMQAIKSLGIEDIILRRYEALHGTLARGNYRLALVTGRLLNSGSVASQMMVAGVLAFGALGVSRGTMTMGSVSALVIIASRIMVPVQRAVFVFVQMKNIGAARKKIEGVLARPLIAAPDETIDIKNEGRLTLDDVAFEREGKPLFAGASLSIVPGEVVALSGRSAAASTALLKLVAGIEVPSEGEVRLNGVPPTRYPQWRLNRAVGYVPSYGTMFRGTIRDNLTRFGEVDDDAVMAVAAIMEIDHLIKELPQGLDTEVLGGATETIPPGLVQQLTLLRALATRPRLILLDNVDRGLDQAGYAKLHRFVGAVHGQASFIIVSDDANLLSYANKRFTLEGEGLRPTMGFEQTERVAYRDFKL